MDTSSSSAAPRKPLCVDGRAARVVLVDNHEVLRLGLAALFRSATHIEVVGQAGTGAEALREALRTRPDVVLLDLRLPDMSGVEVCRDIRSALPETRVLIFTSYADEQAAVAAVAAGAAGYLMKDVDPARVIDAVETVARGGSLLDPAVAHAVLGWFRELGAAGGEPDAQFGSLSDRERDVLRLIERGMTNREIGAELHLTEHTVKVHVSSLLHKLRVARRTELIATLARRRRSET